MNEVAGETEYAELPGVNEAVGTLMAREPIPGVSIALVRGDSVVWRGTYGVVDTGTGEPVAQATPFLLASISKAVTAVALLQVRDAGHFALGDPVSPALDFDVVNPNHSAVDITHEQLFRHTSTIIDDWDVLEGETVAGDSDVPLGEFLKSYLEPGGARYDPSHYGPDVPGEYADYSNVGSALLGHLVEAHTGVGFDAHCEDQIFGPLGMDSAGWHLVDFDRQIVASPHEERGGALVPVPHFGVPDYPNGQLRATAGDLGRFLSAVMVREPLLLEPASIDEMLTVDDDGQGLIWYRLPLQDRDLFGHNGAERGTSTEMYFDAADGTGVVLLFNGAPGRQRRVDQLLLTLFDAVP